MYANELVPSWTGSENIWKVLFSIWYKIHQVKKMGAIAKHSP